jgi:putative aldouronate transport system permease protein
MENFLKFFQGPYFARTFMNTVILGFYTILFGFPSPIILALLLNEIRNNIFKKVTQTLTYLPYFISTVVVAGLVINFLSPSSGLLNLVIEKMGGTKIYFLTKPEYFRPIYIFMELWKTTGFSAIIYIAAISHIDTELYEAAIIDGAGRWKQTLHVTLPGIMNTVVIMLILSIGGILNVSYESIILLYQPATYETADVISTYVYRAGLTNAQYGYATAVGLFNSAVGFVLVFGANYFSKKISETSIW